MSIFAHGRWAVLLVLWLGAAAFRAQMASASEAGRTTQYVIPLSRGAASLQPQNSFLAGVPSGHATPGSLAFSKYFRGK